MPNLEYPPGSTEPEATPEQLEQARQKAARMRAARERTAQRVREAEEASERNRRRVVVWVPECYR